MVAKGNKIMIDLQKTWKIGLSNKKDILSQYVVADSFDDAIKVAQNTFYARLYQLDTGLVCKAGQKCCTLTTLSHPLRFGFGNGHTTIHPKDNDTVYTMLDKAIAKDFVTSDITEVYYHEYLN